MPIGYLDCHDIEKLPRLRNVMVIFRIQVPIGIILKHDYIKRVLILIYINKFKNFPKTLGVNYDGISVM